MYNVGKGVMVMHIMIGDNRLEQVATQVSEAKARDNEQNQQSVLMHNMEEKAKKASSDGVVLEISKAGVNASYEKQDGTKEVEKTDKTDKVDKQAATESLQAAIQEKVQKDNEVASQQRALENINIT